MILQRISKLFFVLLLILIAQAWYTTPAHAATYELYGFAYSSNLGWISFNCENSQSPCSPEFNVNFSSDTGVLTGYAYSSNEGWISFNAADVAGCPAVIASDCTPKVSTTTGKVSGWAKFLHGTGSWINLSSSPYFSSPDTSGFGGVTYTASTGLFVGYAWSEEFGWIDFKTHAGYPGTGVRTNPFVTRTSATSAVCSSFTSTPATQVESGLITLNWTISNVSPGNPNVTTTYSFSRKEGAGDPSVIPGVVTSNPGSYTTTLEDDTTYAITVTNTGTDGTTAKASCTVIVPVDRGYVPPVTGGGSTSKLNLMIGRTAIKVNDITNPYTSQNKNLRINKGKTFALRWAFAADPTLTGYTCNDRTITPLDLTPIAPPLTWKQDWDAKTAVSDTLQIQTDQNIAPASYEFKITCTNIDLPIPDTKSSTARLTISSSTIEEN